MLRCGVAMYLLGLMNDRNRSKKLLFMLLLMAEILITQIFKQIEECIKKFKTGEIASFVADIGLWIGIYYGIELKRLF